MKKATIILALFCAVSFASHGEPYSYCRSIEGDYLQEKGDVYFHPVKKKPYSGKVVCTTCGCGECECSVSHGNMKNGKLHGESKFFDEEGNLYSVRNYKDGKLHGEWKELDGNGKWFSVGNFKDGTGEAKRFHRNGNLGSVQNYKDGKPDGEWKEFYEDGKLQSVRNYIDGTESGEWKRFHRNGNLGSVQNYKDGKPDGEWKEFYEDGKLQSVRNYIDGTESVESKSFYEDGKSQSVYNYKDGKLHGEVKEFHKNGNLKFVRNYIDGTESGEWKLFDKNGNFMGSYKNNKKDGEWKQFDENGNVIKVENYKDGVPEKIQVQDYAKFSRKEKEANEKEEKEIQSSFTDPRDGKTYKSVKIGSQTWMAENLNYNASDSKCYDNKPANCEKYGRLYDWNTALKACPSGWHLPSIYEYETLDNTVGGKVAGKKLKARSGWNKDDKNTDEFGFSALPGGFGILGGSFGSFGNYGYWWSATEYNSYNAYYQGIGYDNGGVNRKDIDKPFLLSVRCLQN